MQEGRATGVTLEDMTGPVLRLLVEPMYGKLEIIQAQALLPLFLAADKYQVGAPDIKKEIIFFPFFLVFMYLYIAPSCLYCVCI